MFPGVLDEERMRLFSASRTGIWTRETLEINVRPVRRFSAAEGKLRSGYFAQKANGSETCDNKPDGKATQDYSRRLQAIDGK